MFGSKFDETAAIFIIGLAPGRAACARLAAGGSQRNGGGLGDGSD